MATEVEIKAKERKELLDEIKRKRAAAAQSEGILGAAERGEYGDVGQGGPKGEFDDEMDQGRGNEDPTVSAFSYFDFLKNYLTDPKLSATGAGIDLLGRLGAKTAPITQKPLETISQGGDNIIQKAGKFLFEDAAKVAAKINSGVSFDELTPGEKFAIASVPAEAIPGLGLAPDILKMAKNFVINVGKAGVKAIEDITQPVGMTNEGITMPMTMSDEAGSVVSSKTGKFMTPDQDSFLLKIIKQRLDEGESYGKLRGSVLEYLQDNPNLLEEAKKLGITDFTNTKIQDRLKNLFAGKITGREGYQLSEENQILIDAIKKFKPDDKESTLFTNYLKDNNLIKDVLSSNKNIDKKSLDRYLNFIRVSSPTTKRAIDGNFGKFIDEFALEIKDLKNTDSIFYKQYEYFKKFDKVRKEAGEKISPFLNKVFPSKTKNPAKNSLQIAHRFMNTQIGKSVPEGLAGTGGTPSTYYLDISRFNSEVQPLIEDQLRTALAKNDVKTLTKLDTQLKEELGAEVIVNGVKFGKHKSIEEKLLKLAQKYEANPKLMKQDGITLEMMRDLYEGIDIISKGASDLGIKMMSSGGIVGISHLTRPLRNF